MENLVIVDNMVSEKCMSTKPAEFLLLLVEPWDCALTPGLTLFCVPSHNPHIS